MLDSQKYPGATKTAPPLNAPDPPTFAAAHGGAEEILTVSGAAWAEYHLLLGASSHHATQIEREIRTFGGAPTIAVLLARWAAEAAEDQATAHIVIALNLVLGRDPNARLLRRELEAWASRLPNLRLDLTEDLAAPEVAYRILMWPEASSPEASSEAPASTCRPQVLQCGEIDWRYEIELNHETAELAGHEESGDDVYQAAWWWQLLKFARGRASGRASGPAFVQLPLGVYELKFQNDKDVGLAAAARRCWESKTALERISCDLAWSEVESEAEVVEQENS